MIHHVYANRSNAGDWVSAKGIQRLLPGQPITDHFCDEPFVARTMDVLSHADETDLIIIGGGGLFMDYFRSFWEALLRAPPAAPICLWGVGLCDLKADATRLDISLLRTIARMSARCYVRDSLTYNHIGLPDLPPPVPCPSVAWLHAEPKGAGILHVDNYTTAGAGTFRRMDRYARAFAKATCRPYRRTNNRLGGRTTEAALGEVLELYRTSDLILSSALHGCVIGVAMGRPVVAVSGDWKIESFMDAMGLGEWVVATAEVGRVPELLKKADEQPSAAARLADAVAANKAIAADILSLVSRSVAAHPLLRDATR